jgi:ABC-2 type transport system permease protein
MLKAIALFELKYQLRRPLLWLVIFVFFVLSFAATVSDTVQIGGAIGNIHRNAPSVILQFHLVLSIIALFITTAFVAGAALRDFDYRTHELSSRGRFRRSTTFSAGFWRGLEYPSRRSWLYPLA